MKIREIKKARRNIKKKKNMKILLVLPPSLYRGMLEKKKKTNKTERGSL